MAAPPRPGPCGTGCRAFFYRHRWVKLTLLLGPPLLWFGVFYLGSLASLLWQSFYRLDDFSGTVDETISLDTWKRPLHRRQP